MQYLKIIGLLVAMLGCDEVQQENALEGEWQMLWITDEEVREGVIIFEEASATVILEERSNSKLHPEGAIVAYTWQRQENKLILTHVGNQFQLEYIIEEERDNYLRTNLFDLPVVIKR